MKPLLYVLGISILYLILLSNVSAIYNNESQLLESSREIVNSLRENYSITGKIDIVPAKIRIGSAENRRYPFIGNKI